MFLFSSLLGDDGVDHESEEEEVNFVVASDDDISSSRWLLNDDSGK